MRSKFVGLLGEVTGTSASEIVDEKSLGDIGIDSLLLIDLDLAVEDKFKIPQGLDSLYTSVAMNPSSRDYKPVQEILTVGRVVDYIGELGKKE